MVMQRSRCAGFTLIELLVVVAIIAILVTIAMVQFQLARVKANLARAQGDFKTIQLGIAQYFIDNEVLPDSHGYDSLFNFTHRSTRVTLIKLTSPISYISTVPYQDPFDPKESTWRIINGKRLPNHYQYPKPDINKGDGWVVYAMGPHRTDWPRGFGWTKESAKDPRFQYNPTNGLKSEGVLWVDAMTVFETTTK